MQSAFGRFSALLALLALAVPSAPARGESPKADIASLAWLAGAWSGENEGMLNEEVWIAPKAGSMFAVHRDTKAGKTVGFEFLRIEEKDGSLVYLAGPEGKPPTPFTLVETGLNRAVFENPALEFPRRIRYFREGDTLHARIEGTRYGKAASKEWTWRRADAK